VNPSPAAVALIAAEADSLPGGWAGNTDAQVAALLNAPSVPNPAPRPPVPKPCAESALFPLLSGGSAVKLSAHPNFAVLKADVDSGNRAGLVGLWCPVLVGGGFITPDEAAALAGWLTGSEPDPDWPEQVSWAEAALGRPVDESDVAAARPPGGQ
jgi:hypothetical protein